MIRAPLFVPANRRDRYGKAAASGADAIILDLEDGVGPDDKSQARAALTCDFTDLPVIVRINPPGSPWYERDLERVGKLPVSGLMLPKSENPAVVSHVHKALGSTVPILALIESATGLIASRDIAMLTGVTRLVFGSIDFCADVGMAHGREQLVPARYELVLASRLAEKASPIDGVTTAIATPSLAFDDAAHARDLGMRGKLCIHPNQIEEVKRAFAPTQRELEWARRVLKSENGAVLIDGEMVDEPVRRRARALLGQD